MKRKELEELQHDLNARRKAIDNIVDNMEEDLIGQYQVLTTESDKVKKVNSFKHLLHFFENK